MLGYIQAVTVVLWLLWPLTTFAAGVTLGQTLASVPLNAWVSVLVLSVVSGLMALLQRMTHVTQIEAHMSSLAGHLDSTNIELYHELSQELERIRLPQGWRVFVTWHMAGAVLMGSLIFFVIEATDLNDFVEAAAIALGAYGGARLFDRASKAFGARVLKAVEQGSSQ